jgi:hypothetical protein
VQVFKTLGIALINGVIGIAFLGLGVFAIRTPEKFLRSRLSRQQWRPETPKWQVRAFGLVMVLGGAIFLCGASFLFANLLMGN